MKENMMKTIVAIFRHLHIRYFGIVEGVKGEQHTSSFFPTSDITNFIENTSRK